MQTPPSWSYYLHIYVYIYTKMYIYIYIHTYTPPSSRTNSSTPTRPFGHAPLTSTIRWIRSPCVDTYSQSLPSSPPATVRATRVAVCYGVLPVGNDCPWRRQGRACIVRDMTYWVRDRGYWEMSELLGSTCVSDARACRGGSPWQHLARTPCNRAGATRVGANFSSPSLSPSPQGKLYYTSSSSSSSESHPSRVPSPLVYSAPSSVTAVKWVSPARQYWRGQGLDVCLYRVAKTRRMPYLYRSFSEKEPYNSWLFCGKRPAT